MQPGCWTDPPTTKDNSLSAPAISLCGRWVQPDSDGGGAPTPSWAVDPDAADRGGGVARGVAGLRTGHRAWAAEVLREETTPRTVSSAPLSPFDLELGVELPRPMLRLTFDTNPLLYAHDLEHPSPVEVDQVLELLERGDADVAIAGVWWRDNAGDRIDERRERLQQVLEGYPSAGAGPFRCDISTFDGPDLLTSEEDAALARELELTLWPGVGARNPKRLRSRMTDVDHLFVHLRSGRDVFVTLDRDVLDKHKQLLERFGIRVARPSEVLGELDRR